MVTSLRMRNKGGWAATIFMRINKAKITEGVVLYTTWEDLLQRTHSLEHTSKRWLDTKTAFSAVASVRTESGSLLARPIKLSLFGTRRVSS